jgi:predicted MPP superfamily phosphohydrolase
MSLVFTAAFTIYGLAHLYLFSKIKSAFLIDPWASILLAMIFLFMTAAPLLIHFYAIRGPLLSSMVFGYIGYLWMAFVLFFLITALMIDLYNLIVNLFVFLLGIDPGGSLFTPEYSFYIPSFLSVVFIIYGYMEARDLRAERLIVNTAKLPAGTERLKIFHISDLHLGIFVREHILNRVIKTIEDEKPDIIVSTGDLVDIDINHVDTLIEMLGNTYARLGKFASTGNHEFFTNIKNSRRLIEKAGFTLLRNSGISIDNTIQIAGIDDSLGKVYEENPENRPESEREILSRFSPGIFTLLLKHRPEIDPGSLGLFDLQLSGHTHKGQIFPGSVLIKLFLYPHYTGFTKLYRNSSMYVSRGAGTTTCPVRFFAPPEVTIVELIPEKSGD